MSKLFNTLAFTSLLAVLSLSPELLADDVRATVSQQQLLSLQSAPKAPAFTLLDVRSPKEYQQGHIPGAVNISHNLLVNQQASAVQMNLLPKDKNQTIVVYCRSGRRAEIAEQYLKSQGYQQVKHLAGDMNGWQEAELTIKTND